MPRRKGRLTVVVVVVFRVASMVLANFYSDTDIACRRSRGVRSVLEGRPWVGTWAPGLAGWAPGPANPWRAGIRPETTK